MPIGFYDDASFRWSPDASANLAAAAAAGATVIHTNANWASIAPTRPANAVRRRRSGVRAVRPRPARRGRAAARAARDGHDRRHAEVGERRTRRRTTCRKHLSDLTTFAHMLATRYNGRTGHGVGLDLVGVERAEPAAVPHAAVRRQEDRQPGELRRSSTRPPTPASRPATRRAVAIGETSPQGRDKPTSIRARASRSPRRPSRGCSRRPRGLKFDAWAHASVPDRRRTARRSQQVHYPNVTLTQMADVRDRTSRSGSTASCRSGSPSTATRRSRAAEERRHVRATERRTRGRH